MQEDIVSGKRVIFVSGKLETLTFFVEKLCISARRMGVEYYVADVDYPNCFNTEEFVDFVNKGNCVVVMMNQIGLKLMSRGENFWTKNGVPIYDFVQDHPYNYSDDLSLDIPDLHLIVIDRDHEDYIRKYFPHIKDIYFMPNGGWENLQQIDFFDREIDIFYAGNCNAQVPWIAIPFFSDCGEEFYRTCYSILIENSTLPITIPIEIYCDQMGFDKHTTEKIISDYGFIISENVRRYFKLKVMHALEKTGARIEICGSGWTDNDEKWAPNMVFHGRVSSQKCNEYSGNAQIGLNFMPWFKRGCSERVFNIMLNGSVCLTDSSEYLLERFSHGENIVFFNYSDIEGLVSDVNFLLSNKKASWKIAQNGKAIAENNDTWFHRMKELNILINKG